MNFIDRQIKRLCLLIGVLALSSAIFWDASERHHANRVQTNILGMVTAEAVCTDTMGGKLESAAMPLPADYNKVMRKVNSQAPKATHTKKGRKS